MEETFLRVKTERDELIKKANLDLTDGRNKTTVLESDEISHLKTELSRQKKAYEAQFIEYVSQLLISRLRIKLEFKFLTLKSIGIGSIHFN